MAEVIANFRRQRNLFTTGSGVSNTAKQWLVSSSCPPQAASSISHVSSQQPLSTSHSMGLTSGVSEPSKLFRRAYPAVGALMLLIASVVLYHAILPIPKPPDATAAQAPARTPLIVNSISPQPPTPKTELPAKVRSSAIGSSAPVRTAALSTMQVEIDYPFKDVDATIWVDNQLVYQRSLHGGVKTHAVLFREVQGHQSDSISVPAGKHRVHVRMRTGDSSYDQSKTISAVFQNDGEVVLHVHCAKRGGEMAMSLQ